MPHIIIDSRESRSPVFAELHRTHAITVEVKELPCADYLPHEHYGVERKDATDFVASIMDRRLFAQVRRMKDEYERQCFIIEGNPYATRSAIAPDPIRGALSYLMAIEEVSVVIVPNATETPLLAQAGVNLGPQGNNLRPKRHLRLAPNNLLYLSGISFFARKKWNGEMQGSLSR